MSRVLRLGYVGAVTREHSVVSDLIRRIASPIPHERDVGADEVTDIAGGITAADAKRLASALIEVCLRETEPKCLEAQLHAMCELKSRHALDCSTFALLAPRAASSSIGPLSEYFAELLAS